MFIYIYKSTVHTAPTLLIIGDDSSRDSLTNSYKMSKEILLCTINLSNTTTTLNSNTDIKVSESVSTKKENRLNSLHLKALGLHDINRLTIELHDALTQFAVSYSNSSFLKYVVRMDFINKATSKLTYLTTKSLDRIFSLFRRHFLSTLCDREIRWKSKWVGVIGEHLW